MSQFPLLLQSSCPINGALSCHNTTIQDSCCFNSPGGLILQTQFWDTNPPTGPTTSWTLHGLWPDNCDGTYEANCDNSRVFKNISGILSSSGSQGQETLEFMNTYWKDYQGDDENFWEHEWSKHGTCISTLDPDCFGDSSTAETDGVLPYFSHAVNLFKTLPTYDWLSDAGIVPSNTASYSKSSILSVLRERTGFEPYLGCHSGALNEVWYFYNVQGSLVDGKFEHTAIVGKTGTCGANVKYLPKASTPHPSKTGIAPGPVPTGSFSGRGYLAVNKGGCLISTGKWYKSGSCATFTATPATTVDGMFSLSSSKGNCAIANDELVCSRNTVAGYLFEAVDGELGRLGYSTDKDISGSNQGAVFEGVDRSVVIAITWRAL